MNKLFVSLVAVMAASSVVMAQGQGGGQGRGQGRGQGGPGGGQGGRVQEVSVPVKILRESLPLTKEKLDVLEADIKVLSSVQLPAEAVLELKLTADQKKSLTEIAKQSQEKVREMMQSGDREGAMALREAVASKVSGVLTEDQKKVVAKYPAPRMGGGRGQGGGRPGGPPPAK
jgi:hypothetical protein